MRWLAEPRCWWSDVWADGGVLGVRGMSGVEVMVLCI
jgi:hypothetical protein